MLRDLARIRNLKTGRTSSWNTTGRNNDAWMFEPGETRSFEGYALTYLDPFSRSEAHRDVIGASMEVARGDDVVTVLRPSLNRFPNFGQPVASPAVHVGITEDLYLSLVRIDAAGITLDVYRYPLMWMLWIGGLVTAGGALFALLVHRPQRRVDLPARTAEEVAA